MIDSLVGGDGDDEIVDDRNQGGLTAKPFVKRLRLRLCGGRAGKSECGERGDGDDAHILLPQDYLEKLSSTQRGFGMQKRDYDSSFQQQIRRDVRMVPRKQKKSRAATSAYSARR